MTFSWGSAFWVQNKVSNATYPRYSQIYPSVKAEIERLETDFLNRQAEIEAKALATLKESPAAAKAYLTDYSASCAKEMMKSWTALDAYLTVKYNDQAIKPEKDGKFELTPEGLGARPARPGFNESAKARIVKETGEQFRMP